jgi:hypothetical protein
MTRKMLLLKPTVTLRYASSNSRSQVNATKNGISLILFGMAEKGLKIGKIPSKHACRQLSVYSFSMYGFVPASQLLNIPLNTQA